VTARLAAVTEVVSGPAGAPTQGVARKTLRPWDALNKHTRLALVVTHVNIAVVALRLVDAGGDDFAALDVMAIAAATGGGTGGGARGSVASSIVGGASTGAPSKRALGASLRASLLSRDLPPAAGEAPDTSQPKSGLLRHVGSRRGSFTRPASAAPSVRSSVADAAALLPPASTVPPVSLGRGGAYRAFAQFAADHLTAAKALVAPQEHLKAAAITCARALAFRACGDFYAAVQDHVASRRLSARVHMLVQSYVEEVTAQLAAPTAGGGGALLASARLSVTSRGGDEAATGLHTARASGRGGSGTARGAGAAGHTARGALSSSSRRPGSPPLTGRGSSRPASPEPSRRRLLSAGSHRSGRSPSRASSRRSRGSASSGHESDDWQSVGTSEGGSSDDEAAANRAVEAEARYNADVERLASTLPPSLFVTSLCHIPGASSDGGGPSAAVKIDYSAALAPSRAIGFQPSLRETARRKRRKASHPPTMLVSARPGTARPATSRSHGRDVTAAADGGAPAGTGKTKATATGGGVDATSVWRDVLPPDLPSDMAGAAGYLDCYFADGNLFSPPVFRPSETALSAHMLRDRCEALLVRDAAGIQPYEHARPDVRRRASLQGGEDALDIGGQGPFRPTPLPSPVAHATPMPRQSFGRAGGGDEDASGLLSGGGRAAAAGATVDAVGIPAVPPSPVAAHQSLSAVSAKVALLDSYGTALQLQSAAARSELIYNDPIALVMHITRSSRLLASLPAYAHAALAKHVTYETVAAGTIVYKQVTTPAGATGAGGERGVSSPAFPLITCAARAPPPRPPLPTGRRGGPLLCDCGGVGERAP
jgi:hypothetical protein